MNKPKFSFIMPVYNDGKFVKRAVESILDQDFKSVEIILVDDGSTDNSKIAIQNLESAYNNVSAIYFKKNKGACIARNEGAKKAKGEIYSFLPADALLYPGMLRIWVNALEDNPDFDFVYGGYRVTDENYNELPNSDFFFEPFDPYLLDITNYIDGSFPIRADKFWSTAKKLGQEGLWDPNIKSLQDWDFWLSVVKDGGKGLYIRDIFFETTMPHKGGLSDDSHNNWLARTDTIKKKHGIKEKRLCVASIGAGWHAKNIAKMLDADFKEMPSFKPHRYDALYVIGFYPGFATQQDQMFFNDANNQKLGRTPAKKIVHFVGTDIWQLYNVSTINLKIWQSYFKRAVDEVLCEDEFVQSELKELGIDSKVVPIPPKKLYKPMPLPKKFTVAVYQPNVNAEFYRPEEMIKIVEKCPDIDFKFFGNPLRVGKDDKNKNLEYMGFVTDMDKFIKECSTIIRFPLHDGLPLSVLEFLMAGRYSITSTPVKYSFCVPEFSIDPVVEVLKDFSKKTEPNKKASEYWVERLNHDKYVKTIKSFTVYNPEEYWENRADSWDKQAGVEKAPIEEIEEAFKKIPIKIESIVDMGCGNGKWYSFLSKYGKYSGFDISKKLIEIAKKNLPEAELYVDKVETFDKKYDVAFSFTTLEHITDENFPKAVDSIKKNAKYLIAIEPYEFDSRYYCHDHKYEEHFNVIYKKVLEDKTIFVCDLQK